MKQCIVSIFVYYIIRNKLFPFAIIAWAKNYLWNKTIRYSSYLSGRKINKRWASEVTSFLLNKTSFIWSRYSLQRTLFKVSEVFWLTGRNWYVTWCVIINVHQPTHWTINIIWYHFISTDDYRQQVNNNEKQVLFWGTQKGRNTGGSEAACFWNKITQQDQ